MVHHPLSYASTDGASWMPSEIRHRVFMTSVEVIEFSHLLSQNENTAKWGWLFKTYMQWQSVAFALSEICIRPPGPDVDRAWRAIESVYDERMVNSKYQKGMLWRPLRHLMAKAKAKRAAQQGKPIPVAPSSRENSINANNMFMPNATPMERFMQEQPTTTNMSTNALQQFNMNMTQQTHPDVDLNAYAQQVAGDFNMPHDGNGNVKGNFVSSTVANETGLNWAPEQLPMDANDVFNFGWAPAVGDFNTNSGEPFQRLLSGMAEEWF
jgi:hypothetical protein